MTPRLAAILRAIDRRVPLTASEALDLAEHLAAVTTQRDALAAVGGDIMQHCNEASACPLCGNDGCSDVDSENEHYAESACAKLETALALVPR